MGTSVALTGMACRVPGAANTAELWEIMITGRETITRRGETHWCGTLDSIDMFDAAFFGIPPRAAKAMDPQQRMLLEVTHDAIGDTGMPAGDLAGTPTGVFIAQHRCDYGYLQHEHGCADDIRAVAGTAPGLTSGRLSHAFDLTGPSLTIDTGCSSALVAVHLAMLSLRSGDCRRAIVAGVNLVLLPALNDAFVSAGMVAPDGRCKFGDASADGFVRSDGVAVVVLEPLTAALASGRRVRSVVRGSALNNEGGRNRDLLTPSAEAQEAMLRAAYADAGVRPGEVDYVEAHGAGTVAGDTAELAALAAVVGAGDRDGADPCLVGSTKTTVGHTESAAGLVGMIAATMCLENSTAPPNMMLDEPHRSLGDGSGITMSRTPATLAPHGRAAIAGVSSFGVSGTNVHVVLEAAPARTPTVPAQRDRRTPKAVLLTASARTERALDEHAQAHRGLVADLPADSALDDLAVAMATARDRYEHRFAVVARTAGEAVVRLGDVGTGRLSRLVLRGTRVSTPPRTTFVFSGHGSQWTGMGRELLDDDRVFADTLASCDAAVQAVAGWSLLEQLRDGHPDAGRCVEIAQPLLWAMQVGLAATWRSWGVEPDAVIGHSMGEVAAAHVAGALSIEESAAVICHRSLLAGRQRGGGTMLHASTSSAEAAALVQNHGDGVVVAACNGPASTVLSGRGDDLRAIAGLLGRSGIDTSWIDIDIAAHSPQMDEPAARLGPLLAALRPRSGTVAMYSTVVDGIVDGTTLDADYWMANLRRPVRFSSAMATALAAAHDHALVEIAPHPVLLPAVADTAATHTGRLTMLGSLRRGQPEREAMLSSLGSLYVAGIDVAGAGVASAPTGRHVDLPAYPWQRQAYWLDAPAPTASQLRPVYGSVAEEATRLLGSPDWESPPWPVAPDMAAAEMTLEEKITARVATILGIGVTDVPIGCPLRSLGMDSMLMAELRNGLRGDTGVTLLGRILDDTTTVATLTATVRTALDRNPGGPHSLTGIVDGLPSVSA